MFAPRTPGFPGLSGLLLDLLVLPVLGTSTLARRHATVFLQAGHKYKKMVLSRGLAIPTRYRIIRHQYGLCRVKQSAAIARLTGHRQLTPYEALRFLLTTNEGTLKHAGEPRPQRQAQEKLNIRRSRAPRARRLRNHRQHALMTAPSQRRLQNRRWNIKTAVTTPTTVP